MSTPSSSSLELTEGWTEFALAKDWSPASYRWYRQRLSRFVAWAAAQSPPVTTTAGLTAPLVRRYIETLRTAPSMQRGREGGPPMDSHTLHGHVRAIRAWLHWLAAEDVVDPKVPARIALPKRESKVLRVLDKRQIERLFLAADAAPDPATATRDRAILSVLLDTGLRAAEVCGLERRDVSLTPDDGYLLVRHGKGRKQREVPLGKKARLALSRYLRQPTHRAAWVFPARGGIPLTPYGLDQILYALVDRAGRKHFEGLKLGAHLYRHTFAVNYLDAGGDIYRLSRIMGHSQVTTTEGYLRAFTATQARKGSLSPLDRMAG